MGTVALWAEVIVRNPLLFRCVIQGRRVDIPPTCVQPGTTVRQSGDQGMVVVPRWLAVALRLA
jgi:hypothetical protein